MVLQVQIKCKNRIIKKCSQIQWISKNVTNLFSIVHEALNMAYSIKQIICRVLSLCCIINSSMVPLQCCSGPHPQSIMSWEIFSIGVSPIISLRDNKLVKIIRKVNSLASVEEYMWYIYLFHGHNWPYQLLCAGPWVCCLEIEWTLKWYLATFLCSKCSLKQSFDNHFNPGGIYYGAKCSAQTSGQLFITFKWWHFSKYHSSCIINNVSITIWKIHGESLSLESLFERQNVPHFPFQS